MAKQDNTIFWIIGIILAVALIYNYGGGLGLFSIQEVCTSNNLNILEDYKKICEWDYGNAGVPNTKCHLSQGKLSGNDLEIGWGSDAYELGEGDVIIFPKSEFDINPPFQDYTPIKEKTIAGVDIFYIQVPIEPGTSEPTRKIFYFCNPEKSDYEILVDSQNVIIKDNMCLMYSDTIKGKWVESMFFLNLYTCESVYSPSTEMNRIVNYFEEDTAPWREGDKAIYYTGEYLFNSEYYFMEFPTVPNFCTNWYLNQEADFLDASGQETWTIEENIKLGKTYFYVKTPNMPSTDGYYWCHNPDLPIGNCIDGIQNQGETGIDCGGPCSPCEESLECTPDYGEFSTWYGQVLYTTQNCFKFRLWMLLTGLVILIGGFIITRK